MSKTLDVKNHGKRGENHYVERLVQNCDTHVLNNVFNVIIYLVKQMSANSIHVIPINIIQNAEANLFLK